jgi:hypothetical protein
MEVDYLTLRRKPLIRLVLPKDAMEKFKNMIPEGYSLKIVKNVILTDEEKEKRKQRLLSFRLTPRRAQLKRIKKLNSSVFKNVER